MLFLDLKNLVPALLLVISTHFSELDGEILEESVKDEELGEFWNESAQ